MAIPDLSSIILSSRVRLARSLSSQPFPKRMQTEQAFALTKKIVDTIMPLGEFKVYTLSTLPKIDVMVMHEKHLLSREMIENYEFSALMLSPDETVSLMINEEDHIREQCILKGLSLEGAYRKLMALDDGVCSKLDIAFDDTLGFLNSDIKNVGTGMKASVFMFLPGLVMTNSLESFISNIAPQGLEVGGIYGEESKGQGYMYQISNARELGRSEREILEEVTSFALAIADAERRARERLLASGYDDVLDIVCRAWGLLTNAHKISATELMEQAGHLKMGVALGLIGFKDNMVIDKLINLSLPFSLLKAAGSEMGELERDKFRAKQAVMTLKNARIR